MKYLLLISSVVMLSACELAHMTPAEVKLAQDKCHNIGLDAVVTRWNASQPHTIACVPQNSEDD